MLVIRRPGASDAAARVQVVLAEHVVHVDARARHDHARPGARRRRQRRGVARSVDDRDVRRAARRGRLGCTALRRASMRRSAARMFRSARRCAASPPRLSRVVKPILTCSALLAHHLDERSQRLGRAGSAARKPIEQREPVGDQHTAGRTAADSTRTCSPRNLVSHRRPPDHAVPPEIVRRDCAARVAQMPDDGRRPVRLAYRSSGRSARRSSVPARSGSRSTSPGPRRAPRMP